jgi:hypothetical protein
VSLNTEMRSCRSLRSQHTVSLFECVRYIVYNYTWTDEDDSVNNGHRKVLELRATGWHECR